MPTAPRDCDNCFAKQPVYKNFPKDHIGDLDHWETSFQTCLTCGAKYVRCFLEDNGYTQSGRWYVVPVPRETRKDRLSPLKIMELVAREERVYRGGSHYKSTGKWVTDTHNYALKAYRGDDGTHEDYDY